MHLLAGETEVVTYLAMLGLWGTLWSAVQMLLLERSSFLATAFTLQVSLHPLQLQRSSAEPATM